MNATHGNGVQTAQPPQEKGLGSASHRFGLPVDCRRILVVGAGGFGREVLQWARDAWPGDSGKIVGFLSDDSHVLDGHPGTLPILGSPDTFEPQPTDGLVLAIGIRGVRREVAEQLAARGARFLTLIHPTAIVADTAVIGPGSVICPYAIVSDAVRLGRFVLVNYHASLGHDAAAADYAVLSPYATLGGGAEVGEGAFLAIHATAGPRVIVGPGVVIAANSCALTSVPAGKLVYGVPGTVRSHVVVDA